MPCLSRNDIEQIAAHVIDQYKHTCLPEKRLCYAVDPLELAHMLGLKVVFRQLSDDGTVLGMTSPDEVCVTIFDDNMEEMLFFLDGKTILIEKKLNEHPYIKPLLTIHDEILFEVPIDKKDEACSIIRSCMEMKPFPEFDVPLKAEGAVGFDFGSLEEI